jgi:hypothetical protein
MRVDHGDRAIYAALTGRRHRRRKAEAAKDLVLTKRWLNYYTGAGAGKLEFDGSLKSRDEILKSFSATCGPRSTNMTG